MSVGVGGVGARSGSWVFRLFGVGVLTLWVFFFLGGGGVSGRG